jgi:PBP1b-binding outer membrane lipoprotein LpoB
MQKMTIAASAVLIALSVSGCTTVSESEYKLGRSYLAENPSFKRELIRDCVADQRRESIGDQKTTAALMGVSVAAYPKLFCSRVINAYANGRLTYRDMTNVSNGSADQSVIVKIVLGR